MLQRAANLGSGAGAQASGRPGVGSGRHNLEEFVAQQWMSCLIYMCNYYLWSQKEI
jgi:hypothetical protein